MDIASRDSILAIVTLAANKVIPGAAPVFLASSKDEQEKLALLLARITGAMVHDLENGVWVLVRH